MVELLGKAKDCAQMDPSDTSEVIGEQMDAFVDIWYYSLNAAAKKGVNMSSLFDIVHAANMAKIDPSTGKCIKRADGKVMKPAGWKAPDVESEIRQPASASSGRMERS